MPIFADYHRTVVGFHGTTRTTAERIVTGGDFTPSQNDYDWLGHGIYLWEYAPQQAYRWARQRYAEQTEVAVLGAMIRLGNCFDLLDPQNAESLVVTKQWLETTLGGLPRNFNAKKYLDCAVFEAFYETKQGEGDPVDTTRAVYVPTEGRKRLWERSWIYRESHVQLCVRNPKNILGVWLVRAVGER